MGTITVGGVAGAGGMIVLLRGGGGTIGVGAVASVGRDAAALIGKRQRMFAVCRACHVFATR